MVMETATHITQPADASHEGQRLDQYLATQLPDLSRARVQQLIEDGQVKTAAGDVITLKRHGVKTGDIYHISIPGPTSLDIAPENIPLEVLYEDEHLLVMNKTANIAVHPAPGNWRGTVVNALLHHCKGTLSGIGGRERPGIVHRLDLGTSGVMVVAKTDKAHTSLSKQFANRTNRRLYRALCYGVPRPLTGDIEGNIARSSANRKKMAVVKSGGKTAKTTYTVLEPFKDDAAFVELKLHTGRTHQIRVHMAHMGYPLIGDPTYGRKHSFKNLSADTLAACRAFPHQALHAAVLGFTHPATSQWMEFETPLPADMAELLALLRNN